MRYTTDVTSMVNSPSRVILTVLLFLFIATTEVFSDQATRTSVRDFLGAKANGEPIGFMEFRSIVLGKSLTPEEWKKLVETIQKPKHPETIGKKDLLELLRAQAAGISSAHGIAKIKQQSPDGKDMYVGQQEIYRLHQKVSLRKDHNLKPQDVPEMTVYSSFDGQSFRRWEGGRKVSPVGEITKEFDPSLLFSQYDPLCVLGLSDTAKMALRELPPYDCILTLSNTASILFQKPEILNGCRVICCYDGVTAHYFDIDKNFTLTAIESYDNNTDDGLYMRSLIASDYYYDFLAIGDGVWFPARVEHKNYDNNSLRDVSTIAYSDIEFNKEWPDSQFTNIFPLGTRIIDKESNVEFYNDPTIKNDDLADGFEAGSIKLINSEQSQGATPRAVLKKTSQSSNDSIEQERPEPPHSRGWLVVCILTSVVVTAAILKRKISGAKR